MTMNSMSLSSSPTRHHAPLSHTQGAGRRSLRFKVAMGLLLSLGTSAYFFATTISLISDNHTDDHDALPDNKLTATELTIREATGALLGKISEVGEPTVAAAEYTAPVQTASPIKSTMVAAEPAVPMKEVATIEQTMATTEPTSVNEQLFEPLNRLTDGEHRDYVCLSWRQTSACSPDGPRDPNADKPCNMAISGGASGFCEIQHRVTGARRRVLPIHCNSMHKESSIRCDSFVELLEYGGNAVKYAHDDAFSYARNQDELVRVNNLSATAPKVPGDASGNDAIFKRGIVMVVYEKLLLGAYVSVRHLRELGSTLPVEMWYRRDETDPDHPLLKALAADYNVFLRELEHPLAKGFYTKLEALYYSAFESVLLLDADNFAVRDPVYLFSTPEFTLTGAMFWPDFWRPGNTLYNLHNQSFVWQLFDLPFVDMFEQESGQVLIDRRRHMKALNVLMYYGFSLPRIHEKMGLVYGDKDLFRFAWLKTNSSFHMITRVPGSAGTLPYLDNRFCGHTMVQHDPTGEIVFLHRNAQKLRADNRRIYWTHLQQFKIGAPISLYNVAWSDMAPHFWSCWGRASNWEELYDLTPFSELPFGGMETMLLRLADEGVVVMNNRALR